jgi:hypothetical protein
LFGQRSDCFQGPVEINGAPLTHDRSAVD